jgi:tetratricopeptide (TPR) repeat protein
MKPQIPNSTPGSNWNLRFEICWLFGHFGFGIFGFAALSTVLVFLVGGTGCNNSEKATVPRGALQPVEFPKLYLVEDEVEQQLKSEYAKLSALMHGEDVEPTVLGPAYGRMGQLFLAYDIVEPAEAALRNAKTLMPNEVRWPYYLGYLYVTLGRWEQAAAEYEQAGKLKPKDVTIWIRLGETYQQMGRNAEAKALLEKAVRVDPTSAKAHFLLGQIADEAGAFKTAITHYEAALKTQPAAASIHYALGIAYRNLGRNLEDIQRSLRHLSKRGSVQVRLRDPFLDEVRKLKRGSKMLSSRASILMIQGRWREAEIVFEQVVAADSNDVLAHLNLGSVRARLGKTEKAVEVLKRAVRLDPSQSVAHMLLGQLYAEQGETKTAEQYYQAALQVDPRNDEAHLGLAMLLRRSGRGREALPHFDKVLDISPGHRQAHLYRAACYIELGKYAKARSLLEAAHEVFPYDRGIRDALVRVLAASPVAGVRDGKLALTLAEKRVADSNRIKSAEALAMAYAELGRFAEAIQWQETAIEGARTKYNTDYLDHLRNTLLRYKQGKPSRTPWGPFYDEK